MLQHTYFWIFMNKIHHFPIESPFDIVHKEEILEKLVMNSCDMVTYL